MHTQGIPSVESWPEEATARNGVVVASGYGIRIRVWRCRLRVDDGIGANRRGRLYHRATSGLKRLVVLGHTGYVSLEALRWLADIKAGYLQVDADGRVLAAFGPPGTDRPTLRRAQAVATGSEQGLKLSRWLVDAKLAAQAETLRRFADRTSVDEAVVVIDAYRMAIADVPTVDELRQAEAWAAGAYWQALAPLAIRFARRDAGKVPSHWRTFGGRGSPLTGGPRLATNPANALLSYLYALLEAEATLAARIVGLDPGLGVMHVDQAHRASLAADLMEPVRPLVDAYSFELLTTRPFAARDFYETRTGVCRVTPPLTHELAETLPRWRQLVGRLAEDFASALESGRGPSPTPITERRRASARAGGARPRPPSRSSGRACSWCGSPKSRQRKTCSDACAAEALQVTHEQFAARSAERLRKAAAAGERPSRSVHANERRRQAQSKRRAEELAWDAAHPGPVGTARFAEAILPGLQTVSAGKMARATGLSVSYCAEIKRGKWVPHPRWWPVLVSLRGGPGT